MHTFWEEEFLLMTNSNNTEVIPLPKCPFCGSLEVLPFEDDKDYSNRRQTFTLILLSAFSLFGAYILFLLSAYLFFPGVVILSIFFFTKIVNDRERKKIIIYDKKNFICIKCGNNFEYIEKKSKIV